MTSSPNPIRTYFEFITYYGTSAPAQYMYTTKSTGTYLKIFLQYAVTFESFSFFNVFLRGYLIPTFYSETVDFKVLLLDSGYLYPCLMNVIVLSVGTC